MSSTAKSSLRPPVATLLALAAAAAALSGSALRAPAPPAAPKVAVVAPAAVPVASPPGPVTAAVAVAAIPQPAPALAAPPVPSPQPETVAAQEVASAPAPIDLATLRGRLHWLSVQVNGRVFRTPDPDSRLLLARSAAERAHLSEVGLDFRDVYGVITAETSWVARTGMGRNGVASQGLAQLEPATARALGVHDANDPVEAVHAAAKLLKEAGAWSARRIAGLGLSGAEHAARLREGISVYYNLSSRARQRWNGLTHTLPVETRRHISNVRAGIEQAERLETGTGPSNETLMATAAATARMSNTAAPVVQRTSTHHAAHRARHPVGTITWSGRGSRAGTHVVWSNGTVTREGGRVHGSNRARG